MRREQLGAQPGSDAVRGDDQVRGEVTRRGAQSRGAVPVSRLDAHGRDAGVDRAGGQAAGQQLDQGAAVHPDDGIAEPRPDEVQVGPGEPATVWPADPAGGQRRAAGSPRRSDA
jgi:hypothetical protein